MSFLEQRLDTGITQGAQVRPTNPGRIKVYTESGRLTQRFTRAAPKHEMDVSHGLRSAADFQTLVDLWYVVHFTPYTGFRVRMQSDYQATATNSTLTLITGTTYQLQRKHVFGAVTVKRDIFKPCASPAVVVYNASNDVLTGTTDTTNGHWTGSGTPAYWTGQFDLPMTFSDNEWTGSLELNTRNLQVSSESIKLEEILL